MNALISQCHSRSRLTVAIVTTLCLLAAAAGCWLVRVDHAASAPYPPAAESIAKKHSDFSQLGHATAPSIKAPLKSAGMRRGRPPSQPNLASRPSVQLLSIASHCDCFGLLAYHAHAPAPTFSQCDLLTHICIDRR